jgi:hypothetical protein
MIAPGRSISIAIGYSPEVGLVQGKSMRKFVFGLALSLIAAVGVSLAADKVYQKGKYLDVSSQAYQKAVGDTSVLRHENDMSVQIGDVIYVGQCEEKKHFSSCRPGTWIIGDMIEVRVENDHMYLKKPDGGEVKTQIVKRVRVN